MKPLQRPHSARGLAEAVKTGYSDEGVFDTMAAPSSNHCFFATTSECLRHGSAIPERARVASFARGRREIEVLRETRVDEAGGGEVAADRRNPPNARLEPQPVEGGSQAVRSERDVPDPRPHPEPGVSRDAVRHPQSDHRRFRDAEQQCREVQPAPFETTICAGCRGQIERARNATGSGCQTEKNASA